VTDNPYRLPRVAVPTRYDLLLEPDLESATFRGIVDIALDVREATTTLVGNAAELEFDATWLVGHDGGRVEVELSLDEATERFTVTVADPLPAGPITLHTEFRGTLNDKLHGWYRSTYIDHGISRTIATSQMQATDCRRAFPCWDEPDLKAVFGVTMIVEENILAISNGAELDRTPVDGGRVKVRFADTMAMSTYLVAFVVGPLEVTAPIDVDGVPLRIVHVPGKSHLAAFAAEIGAYALRWYQNYYGIPYPGEKVDLVALPDFAAGAMENLGCITFREALLLLDPATSTQTEMQTVADVTAHELAHMWFGDLVTMRWWNGLWLNEAFATFMEVACCNSFRPDWKRWENFGLERTAAFDTDALIETRPIEYEVVSPDDADGMFDVLTYEKGAALLRMCEQYLGPERFRDGIRTYLNKHAYANTETSDLWDALEATTGEPVRRIMDSWVWKGGFPVVTTGLAAGGKELVLSQRRFLFDGDDDGSRWAIPLQVRQIAGGAERLEKVLLDGDEVRVPLLAPEAAVVVNAGGDGFYRVQYVDGLLDRLTGPTLASLSTIERYNLVDDAWANVMAGSMSATAYCAFARHFASEPALPVWQVLLAGLRFCDRLLDGEARERFREFVRSLVGPALERLGWEPKDHDDDLTRKLRGLLIGSLAVLGNDAAAQTTARRLHEQAAADPAAVDPEVALATLSVVAATGDRADYEQCLEGFRRGPTPQEQLRNLYALAEFHDPALMEETLAFMLSGEVKTQNAPFVLGRCIANRDHGEQAWRFVREHWSELGTRFPANTIVRMIDPVKLLIRPEQQLDVAGFFAEHAIPQSAKTLQQVLERQRVNAAVRERDAEALGQAFS
jgi:puromycin-sensitive aminopeptidase